MKNEIINLKKIIAKIADVELQEKLIIMIDQSDNFHPLKLKKEEIIRIYKIRGENFKEKGFIEIANQINSIILNLNNVDDTSIYVWSCVSSEDNYFIIFTNIEITISFGAISPFVGWERMLLE